MLMPNDNQHYTQQRGHTLLELMLSLSLGLFILSASLSFYQSTQKAQKIQKVVGIARENAKFAFDLIKSDIQMAGFYGCISKLKDSRIINSLNNPDDFKWNFLQAIFASENSGPKQWSPPLDASLANADVYTGDVLTLRYADRQEFNLATHSSNDAPIKTTEQNNLRRYDYGLVSDCVSGSIFQKTNSSAGSLTIQHKAVSVPNKYAGNATEDLGYTFSNTAKLRRLYSISYYIAKKTGRIPALYRKEGSRRAEEVISGITDMQLRFGIDSNADGAMDTYLSADQVQAANNWNKVVLLNLSIVSKAYKEHVITGNEVVLYNNGAEIQYQLYANIALRNHLP
jgi:type IV pilus assembly protein PilW